MSEATHIEVTAEVVKPDALAPAFAGLEASTARQLREAFVPALLQIEEWESQAVALTVTDETQTAKMEMAGVMRKALKKVRVGVDKKRKELNADALARTKAINHAAGIVESLIVPLEKHLQEQETYADRAAEGRTNALRSARSEALLALGADPSVFSDLGATSETTWATILENARLAHEARLKSAREAEVARIEAERVAEEQREAARVEAARVEAARVERERAQAEENARLRAEAEQREISAKAERDKAAAERAEIEAKAKAEREAAEAEARTAREAEAKIAVELEATRKAERDRADAEAKRVADEKAAADAAARAPDVDKLIAYSDAVYAIDLPTMASAAGQDALERLKKLRSAFLVDIAKLVVAKEGEAAQ